jgi:hypothetical protein
MAIKGADTPKKPSRGIEKLVNGHGLVNTDLLRRVRQHAGDVMRSGISADSTIRYESSLKGYYEYSKIVGKEPLYGSGWGATAVAESHLAYQQHVVEYLSFLHLVNENKAPTLRSKLSHLSWAHTSTARDDPLKKHQATYVEAWMRALERREPRSAAGNIETPLHTKVDNPLVVDHFYRCGAHGGPQLGRRNNRSVAEIRGR